MRTPSDYPVQSQPDALGETQHPPLMPEVSAPPRFTLETTGQQPRPEWERNMLQYGGLAGEKDVRELQGAAERAERQHRQEQMLEMLIGGQANALYSVHTALALLQKSELTPGIIDRLDQLFFYAGLTMERTAALIGKQFKFDTEEKEQR